MHHARNSSRRNGLDLLAFVVSAITSPFVTISVFGVWVMAVHAESPGRFLLQGALCALLVLAVPLAYIGYGMATGRISDVHVMDRRQRGTPFLLATGGALLLVGAYHALGAPLQIQALAVALLLNGVVFALCTVYWKVSIHAAAYTGSVLIVSVLINPSLAVLFAGLPMVAWARMRRHRHNLWQALLAVVAVVCTTLAAFLLVGVL